MVTRLSPTPRRHLLAAGLLAALALSPSAALADPPPASPAGDKQVAKDAPAKDAPAKVAEPDIPIFGSTRDPVMEKASASRRSGFAVNLSFGNGIASIVGYPNDAKKIGYARYYYESGARPSGVNMLWLGGAITDWFVFGVGFTGSGLNFTGQTTAFASGTIFHGEVFPLFYRGGAWRDVGVMIDAGLGAAQITDDSAKLSHVEVTTSTMDKIKLPYFTVPKEKLVDGGSASLIGAGVFYEAARIWRVRIAPFMYVNYIWSDTVRRPGFFLGVHSTFYWNPGKN
ncbi:MAG: hypothetical protein U0359_38355 [Byssovorax sp.]